MGFLTYGLGCKACGHRWTPRKKTWKSAVVRCPMCGQKSKMPSGGVGCSTILVVIAVGVVLWRVLTK